MAKKQAKTIEPPVNIYAAHEEAVAPYVEALNADPHRLGNTATTLMRLAALEQKVFGEVFALPEAETNETNETNE
jgi:hypothetical protein